MLPIVDKPAIQYVVEEAAAAGLRELIIIIGPAKTPIERHFSADPRDLERFEAAGKLESLTPTLALIRKIPIRFVTQESPRGLGDAIYQARHVVGEEPFAVLLGDDIMVGKSNPTKDLLDAFEREKHSLIGVQEVPRDQVQRYGIVDPGPTSKAPRKIRGIVEKPSPSQAPSRFAAVGRYVFTPAIFDCIRQTKPGRGGEIQLTDAVRLLLKREAVSALRIDAHRLDVGGKLEWLLANIEVALSRAELSPGLRAFLRSRLATPNRRRVGPS